MELKRIRMGYGITQREAADACGMALRSYVRYENDDSYGDALKRKSMFLSLSDKFEVSETKGILTLKQIQERVKAVLDAYPKEEVAYCYLFGSYAMGYAKGSSDVDLCVSTTLTGFKFAGLAEKLHDALHKRIDLIRVSNLLDNADMLEEIMKDGVKIYG